MRTAPRGEGIEGWCGTEAGAGVPTKDAATRKGVIDIPIPRAALIAAISTLVLVGPAQALSLDVGHVAHHRVVHHRRGCNTSSCDREADAHYRHRRAREWLAGTRITPFDLCVANRENGEPGSTAFAYINWRANNNYEGAFSWEHSKWVAGGGLRFAQHPYEATPQQQVAVFHQNGRNGEWTSGNWPTIPPCRGMSGS